MQALSLRKTLILSIMFLFTAAASFLQAQVTEHFADEAAGASTFTNSSVTYNLTGGRFVITHFVGYGYTGTAPDSDYVDNYGNYPASAGVLGTITNLTNWFKVYDLYIFPGVTGDFVSNAGTVVIRGKHGSTTQFTHTVESASINTAGYITNGWTYVNLTSYSSYEIDQLEFEVTGSLRYLAIDAFRHLTTGLVPVELSSFTASTLANKVILNWHTATEVSNYGFEVERRAVNGEEQMVKSWQKIGFVAGAGTSNVPKEYSYLDASVNSGNYIYRLKQIDQDGTFEYSYSVEVSIELPEQFALNQNYPNPFNPSTTIAYQIQSADHVLLKVFDVLGKEVAILVNEVQQPGIKSVKFDASGLTSGIYYYRLQTGSFTQTRKLLLLK